MMVSTVKYSELMNVLNNIEVGESFLLENDSVNIGFKIVDIFNVNYLVINVFETGMLVILEEEEGDGEFTSNLLGTQILGVIGKLGMNLDDFIISEFEDAE
jgi:hypothetical protein